MFALTILAFKLAENWEDVRPSSFFLRDITLDGNPLTVDSIILILNQQRYVVIHTEVEVNYY